MSALAELLNAAPRYSTLISFNDNRSVGSVIDLGLRADLDQDVHVAIVMNDQLKLAEALVVLDGEVDTLLLLPPGMGAQRIRETIRKCGCNLFVSDIAHAALPQELAWTSFENVIGAKRKTVPLATRWSIVTSGTTGTPKVVSHSLGSLSRTVRRDNASLVRSGNVVWGLTYDASRFAGLQVLLQALITGADMVALDQRASYSSQLATLIEFGCTHLSATPTYWRQLLMSPSHRELPLTQVTLGGEIADQSILTALQSSFPEARITHVYASTETGVGFSVTDGIAGFPASFLESPPGSSRIKIVDGILWLKPPNTRVTHGGEMDPDGYVRTGDMVRLENNRVQFLGRDSGMMNVGGVKIYPEVVEAVIRSVPSVSLVRVSGKPNPLMGTLVVADIVLEKDADARTVRQKVRERCSSELTRHAMPAVVRFVSDLKLGSTGKIARVQVGQ